MHAEVETLVVERGDRISDDLVGKLADRLAHQLLRRGQFFPCHAAGHAHRGLWVGVEDNAPFDIARQRDQRRHPMSSVALFFHTEVPDGGRALQAVSQHGVGRVDEWLDQLHPHVYAPAPAALATTASSPSTYLITS